MKKKVLGVLLAGTMVASVVGAGAMSVSAAEPTGHGTYTPSAGVDTYKYYFAIPGCWINDSTKVNNDAPGLYWWAAPDDPDTKFGHGWPGYELDKEADGENLYSINAPKLASILVFNNYLDGGMDNTLPIFSEALQCKNKNVEYYNDGDSYETYSQKFWEYMWTLAAEKLGYDTTDPDFDYMSDDLYMDVLDNPDKIDFTPEFGEYGKNFFSETENESGLAMNFQNMIYIVDLNPDHIEYVNQDLIPGGKPAYDGEFYFMYGNGEYGMWPTKEMALKMEGVTQKEDGTYEGGEVDEYGTVRNADGNVVVGNYTGKYYEESEAPTVDPSKATDSTSSTTPTGSSTSDSGSIGVYVKVEAYTTWTKGSGKDADFKLTTTDATFKLEDELKGVYVNGELLDPKNYTVKANEDGSVVVSVKAAYMETLKNGDNKFTFSFADELDENTSLSFTVKVVPAANNGGAGSSTTDSSGDSGNSSSGTSTNGAIQTGSSVGVIVLLVLAAGAVVALYFKRRKLN